MYPILKVLLFSGANIWEKLLVWYENSLLRELLEHFSNVLFGMEFGTYENFSVSGSAGATVRNVIIGLVLGLVLAAGVMFRTRTVQGRFIRALLRAGCHSQESAITLREAGMFRSPSVRRELASGNGMLPKLTRTVSASVENPAGKPSAGIDFTTARFYIPEDLKYRAEVRYERAGSHLPHLLLTCFVGLLLAFLLCRLAPILLNFADWLISALAP